MLFLIMISFFPGCFITEKCARDPDCREGQRCDKTSGNCIDLQCWERKPCASGYECIDGSCREIMECRPAQTRSCGEDKGVCTVGIQTCQNTGTWGHCSGDAKKSAEICDGLDNDCNSQVDDGLTPPACPKQLGVCKGSVMVCGGTQGWLECKAGQGYPKNYVAEEDGSKYPEHCDSLDNDCDGQVDEGCACKDGEEKPCGVDIPPCKKGIQRCINGIWGNCEGDIMPTQEICDGIDNDCNGKIDDGLIPEPCENQKGVCKGSTKICSGEKGWLPCAKETYEAHSKFYEHETEKTCDSLDNNCDGQVDEGEVCAACPKEMVKIDNYCIDRHEASRPDATETSHGTDNTIPQSRLGVMPWHNLTREDARAACQRAGKRLCTVQEWGKACKGSQNTTYGYGNDYEPTTCNGIDAFGGVTWKIMPTGSFDKCQSDYGVYDLNGNLWEYDDDPTGNPRGGAFNCGDSAELHKCDGFRKNWPDDYNHGFRCCRDARSN
jgi:hypothetical protein